jgi:membrane associated rhomboid family serine protease
MLPLKDDVRARNLPIMNYLIIAANFLVFLFELALGQQGLDNFINRYALTPQGFTGAFGLAAVASLFISMFLHGGWLHIISNMWALFIFGDNVEDRMGHLRYLLFYLIAGVGAALTHVFVSAGSTVPVVGASGAIAGVMGAYLVLYPRARVLTLVPLFIVPWFVQVPAVVFIGFWFLTQLLTGVASLSSASEAAAGGIAVWAHVGGFIVGALLVRLFIHRQPYRQFHQDEYYPW